MQMPLGQLRGIFISKILTAHDPDDMVRTDSPVVIQQRSVSAIAIWKQFSPIDRQSPIHSRSFAFESRNSRPKGPRQAHQKCRGTKA